MTALHVQEGQRVEVGEALASQDVRRLHAQQKELQSQRAQAVAELDELLAGHDISCQWVRGHAGHAENERCDRMAVEAYQRLK